MSSKEISILGLVMGVHATLLVYIPMVGIVSLALWMLALKKYQALSLALGTAVLNLALQNHPNVWLNLNLLPLMVVLIHTLKPWILQSRATQQCSKYSYNHKRVMIVFSFVFLSVNWASEFLAYSLVHFNVSWLWSGLVVSLGISLLNSLILVLILDRAISIISKGLLKLGM